MLKLKTSSLEWALNCALNYGDTDIFPDTFEFKAIEFDRSVLDYLANEDILSWNVGQLRQCLVPKHRYGFRISSQLDPLDFLIYTAIIYEIGQELESTRIELDRNIVHSYRLSPKPDGQMYSRDYNYTTFRQAAKNQVKSRQFTHVVIADIADFFPRLYEHRVYNALNAATTHTNHAKAISRLLKQWTEHYSYGIPVGPAASHLISEVAINDVDRLLLSEQTVFVRYSDDYRIFCTSIREAHEKLALLANVLFSNHGLTLQQSKTKILDIDKFEAIYLQSEETIELNELTRKFNSIVEELGLDQYDNFKWGDLPEKEQKELEELNLVEILKEQSDLDDIDIGICKFVLRRLAQIGNEDGLDTVLNNIDKLYPVFKDVVKYITALRISPQDKITIGSRMLSLIQGTTVSHLEYHRSWLLNIFTHSEEYNNKDEFVKLYNRFTDEFSQREIILALGRSKQDFWFRTQKQKVFSFTKWTRRALLLAASCFPPDERKNWYDSLLPRLDILEKAVVKYARQNPF